MFNGLKKRFEEAKERKKAWKAQEEKYKEAHDEAYRKEKMKRLPELAKMRVKREMKGRLNKQGNGGNLTKKLKEVGEAGTRLSEALVGKPGENIPTQEELKKRRWM